jgi:hypothetical protein
MTLMERSALVEQQAAVAATISFAIRKFGMADLQKHGGWIMRRLQKVRPHLSEAQIMTWLKGIIVSNEFLFLYQEHGVALAQAMREETLDPSLIVRERFVFAEEGFESEAAGFYAHFKSWAVAQQAKILIVEEMTDVPHDLIKEEVGRVYERKQFFARL